MEGSQLLVGSMLVSATVIKFILQCISNLFPKMTSQQIQLSALLLGIPCAFITDASLFAIPKEVPFLVGFIFNKLITGMFIGTNAMGVHEFTKISDKTRRTTP